MTALERAIRRREPVRAFGAHSPMEGLDRRSVGFFDVLAQSVAAVAPAGAATTIVLLIAGIAPGATVVSLVIAGVLSLLVGNTVSQFARRFASSGALYTYAVRGLGVSPGLATGAAIIIGYAGIAMFTLLGGAYYTTMLLADLLPGGVSAAAIAVVLAVESVPLVFVLVRGIRISARVALVIEAASVTLIVALLIVLLSVSGPIELTTILPGPGTSWAQIAAGSLIALTAYVGFESAATLGVEARSPLKTIPRAIRWTVVLSGGLYVLSAITQVTGFAALGAVLADSAAPINELAGAHGFDGWAVLADLGVTASFIACAIGSTTALSRVLFTMGRDGVLPAFAGRTHARFGTPIGAITLVLPLVIAVPFVLIVSGVELRTAMHWTISIGGIGFIVAYILVCVAAPAFLRRIGELTASAVIVASVSAAALLAALVAFVWVDLGSGSAAVWIAAGLAGGVWIGIWMLLRRRGAELDRIGAYDEPVASQVLGGVPRPDAAGDDR